MPMLRVVRLSTGAWLLACLPAPALSTGLLAVIEPARPSSRLPAASREPTPELADATEFPTTEPTSRSSASAGAAGARKSQLLLVLFETLQAQQVQIEALRAQAAAATRRASEAGRRCHRGLRAAPEPARSSRQPALLLALAQPLSAWLPSALFDYRLFLCLLMRPTIAPFVRRLEPADLAWATALLLAASDQHPVLRHCCAGPTAPAQRAWLVELLLRFGLRHGRVYADADGLALTVWLSTSHLGAARWPLLRAGLLPAALWRLGWAGLLRLRHHLRAAASLREQAVDPGGHHYLLALAVHPAARGQGRGRRLLQATLAAMQATAAVPCYLDTQGPEQLPFFQRLGFQLAGQCPAGREADAPITWGLLRAGA